MKWKKEWNRVLLAAAITFIVVFSMMFFNRDYISVAEYVLSNWNELPEISYDAACDNQIGVRNDTVFDWTIVANHTYDGVKVYEMNITPDIAGFQVPKENVLILNMNISDMMKRATILHETCHIRQYQEGRVPEDICGNKDAVIKLEKECNGKMLNYFEWFRVKI